MPALLIFALSVLFCSNVRAETNPPPLPAEIYRIAALKEVVPESISQMILEAYKRIGITANIVYYPGERALFSSNAGTSDAELARIAVVDDIYPDLVRVPVPLTRFDGVAFAKKQLPIQTWNDFAPYKTGIEVGVKFAEDGTKQMHPIAIADRDRLFQLLEADRLDVVVHVRYTGEKALNRLGFKDIYILDPPLTSGSLYHFVHKKHAAIIPALSQALMELINNDANDRQPHEPE